MGHVKTLDEFFIHRHVKVCRAPEHVLRKARRLIGSLEDGTPYWKLRGKRMAYDRTVVSIPIGRSWRILARDVAGRIVAEQVLSHEQYNHRT